MKNTEFLTVREIADVLRVNPITIYDYVRVKKLPAIKIGRYYRVLVSDFERFIAQRKIT